MSLFRKKYLFFNSLKKEKEIQLNIPDNLIARCPSCRKPLINSKMTNNKCCYHCGHHFTMGSHERIEWLCDEGSFEEWATDLKAQNPLQFPNYEEKIKKAQEVSGTEEAIVVGQATINQWPCAIAVMDSSFVMASMGIVVGEKIVRLFDQARLSKLPVILYVASGGARMQEGILSLMQMAKVSFAINQFAEAGLMYISVLTHPTMGGVTASFAMQADLIVAEPGASIGFAGKRVIEQTIKAKLPLDFQKAEKVFAGGFLDRILPRTMQKTWLERLLILHSNKAGEKDGCLSNS